VHADTDDLADLNLRADCVVREVPLGLVKVDQDIRVELIPDGLELVERLDSALATDVTLATNVAFDDHEWLVLEVLVRNKDETSCISRCILAHSIREEPEVSAHRIQEC